MGLGLEINLKWVDSVVQRCSDAMVQFSDPLVQWCSVVSSVEAVGLQTVNYHKL